VIKKWVIGMFNIIASIIILILEILFLIVVLIINNIDKFIDWLSKRNDKR